MYFIFYFKKVMSLKKYVEKYSNFTINNKEVEYYDTYIEQLDNILEGGLPKGKIVEIFGHEGSGKSTLLLSILAKHTHNKNQFVVLIDTEGSIYSNDNLIAAGFNLDNTLLLSLSDGEKIFNIIEDIIVDKNCCMIAIDSIACMVAREEIDGKDSIGAHARMLSKEVKILINTMNVIKSKTTVIFINQLRSKINDAWKGEFTTTTTGGKAMKYYPSLRMKMERMDYIKDGKDNKIGFYSMVKIEKSRNSKPQVFCLVPIIYGSGVRQEIYFLDSAIEKNIIIKTGAWYSIDDTKEEINKIIKESKISKTKFQGKSELIYDICNNNLFFNLIKMLVNKCK